VLHGIPLDDLAIKLDHLWREATHDKNRNVYQLTHCRPGFPRPKMGQTRDPRIWDTVGLHARITGACMRELKNVPHVLEKYPMLHMIEQE
jgi:hypothetical protein